MRSRVVGLSIGVLALASACATSTGSGTSSRFDASPAPEPTSRRLTRAETDSIAAQSFADHEGPRVDIRATYTQVSSSRRMRANFHVDDDAYVVIGQVDADGVVRIVFPNDPKDEGFVKGGGRSYQTSEFFAGFTDEYRFRYNTYGRFSGFRPDAYDGGMGYLFIVASWRPMNTEKFVTDGEWDSFEITDARYLRDPRPSIYELAALLAGENREAYTVKFAKYYNTMSSGAFSGYSAFSSGGICNNYNGFHYSGFGFDQFSGPALWSMMSGEIFYYRGQRYAYDGLRDCAVPLGYGYNSGYGYPYGYSVPRIAQTPPLVPGGPVVSRPRILSAEDSPRNPTGPVKPTGGKVAPVTAKDAGTATNGLIGRVSPAYRERGLITPDEPGAKVPAGRTPRVGVEQQERTRPSIQQMTERRTQNQNDGTGGFPRVHADNNNNNNNNNNAGNSASSRGSNDWQRQASEPRSRGVDNSGADRGYSRPTPSDGPRSAPAPRSEPARSSPPPSAPPPRAEPPASSSTGTRPITP